MVRIKFDPNSVRMCEFEKQIGCGEYSYFVGGKPFQRGFGYYQNGAGVSDFLRSLWRSFLPLAKSAGHAVGKEALSTGFRILENLAQGENIKDSVAKETIKVLTI